MIPAKMQMTFKTIMQSERRQTVVYTVCFHLYKILDKVNVIQRDRKQISSCLGITGMNGGRRNKLQNREEIWRWGYEYAYDLK